MRVIAASVLLVMTSLCAAQPFPGEITQEGEQGKFHSRMLTSDTEIPEIMCEVSRLLENGVDPKKIVCIFDVDGTLTDESYPTFAGESSYPRSGAMITFVRSLHILGVTMVASSAWDIFDHTVGRIRQLGLLDVFLSKDSALSTKTVLIRDRSFMVHSLGNIISVRDIGSPGRYYRAKFLSTFFANNEMPIKSIFPYSHVFFFDDSERNVTMFHADFKWYFQAESPTTFTYLLVSPMPNISARQSSQVFS